MVFTNMFLLPVNIDCLDSVVPFLVIVVSIHAQDHQASVFVRRMMRVALDHRLIDMGIVLKHRAHT